MPDNAQPIRKRAPTLYAIIIIKLLKGLLFLSLAVLAFAISDNDLPAEFRNLLHQLRLNPERRFFADLAVQIGKITEVNVLWVAAGTMVYSLFSLVEGIGLIFRVTWACWMAISESAFFIPIEVYELVKPTRKPSLTVLVILILNIVIVWYLAKNRHRLFHHHHHHAGP